MLYCRLVRVDFADMVRTTVVCQTAKHVAAGEAERVSMLQRKMLRAEHSKIQELVSAAIGKQFV